MNKISALTAALGCLYGISQAGLAFTPPDTNFLSTTMVVPASPVTYDVLFKGYKDTVTTASGQKTVAKDWHDFTGYIPINGRSDSGYVIVNHEMNIKDPILGDGGGMTVFSAAKNAEGRWDVVPDANGKFRHVDFSEVGGTVANCGGAQTPWGTVLTAEEWMQTSNEDIADGESSNPGNAPGITDTSDFTIEIFNGQTVNKTIKKFQNLNWMVEVDPKQAKAVKKRYNMGRFGHEGGFCMPDSITVYLTDDQAPGMFYKFVSEQKGNYDKGQLHAYKQSQDGMSGTWIPLPMDLDSMMNVTEVSLKKGATMFIRLEWIEGIDGKLYFTETGTDNSGNAIKNGKAMGGVLAKHLESITVNDTVMDPYGRVLRFDPATNKVDVLINGGAGTTTTNHLSNPDGLSATMIGGKPYLFIQEDLNGHTLGRVPDYAAAGKVRTCELYVLDLTNQNPKVDDLKRFLVGPMGTEVTGGRFTPDGKTFFVNMQHPVSSNPDPWGTSVTVAFTGYAESISNVYKPSFKQGKTFQLDVDPVGRMLHFNKLTDVALFSPAGKKLLVERKTDRMDVSRLQAGNYFIKSADGDVVKIVLQ